MARSSASQITARLTTSPAAAPAHPAPAKGAAKPADAEVLIVEPAVEVERKLEASVAPTSRSRQRDSLAEPLPLRTLEGVAIVWDQLTRAM